MRFVSLVVLCVAAASAAQTHVDATGTVGVVAAPATGSVTAQSAFDVLLERGFESRLTVSARLAAGLLASETGALSFQDLSSSVRVQFRLRGWESEAVYLELFPFNGRRVRPSFDFANNWGKTIRARTIAPLLTAGFVRHNASVWAAARAYSLVDDFTLEPVLRWTGMLGGGVALPGGLRSDLILTVIDRGNVPGLASQGILKPVLAWGGSARLAWQAGGGVAPVLDPASYENDPDRFARLFARERYELPRAAYLGLEGGLASQNLEDPDVFGTMRRSTTGYADLQARVRIEATRLFATFRLRPPAFITFDVPGLPPYKEFPTGTVFGDEYTALLGVDHHFAGLGLTPGLVMRVIRPAWFRTAGAVPGGNIPPPILSEKRVVVVRGERDVAILPQGQHAEPTFEARASLLFNRFELLSALLQVSYGLDPNLSIFQDATGGNPEPIRIHFQTVSVSLLLQLRL